MSKLAQEWFGDELHEQSRRALQELGTIVGPIYAEIVERGTDEIIDRWVFDELGLGDDYVVLRYTASVTS